MTTLRGLSQNDQAHRLCNSAKEATPCNDESTTPLTTAFTPNSSTPHGIRWSKLTKKVYSIQEGYHTIAEIDPTSLAITNTFDLNGYVLHRLRDEC